MADIWSLDIDDEAVAWLGLDVPDQSVNTLDRKVMTAFGEVLTSLEADPPKGLVLRSRKDAGFMAGADVKALGELQPDALRELIEEGKALIGRLAALDCPTAAMIHGHCMGGGLEIALACDRRVARADASIGLPETRLGLIPGLGGVRRLIALIGPAEAMKMMLTGKAANARKAKSLGLVDEVVEDRHLATAARHALKNGAHRSGALETLKKGAMDTAPGRAVLASQMRRQTADKAPPEHYPAPHRLIDIWEAHGASDKLDAAETEAFLELAATDVSKNLRRVFLLMEDAKSRARLDAEEMRIARVHVTGAGAMGADIASLAALKGFEITIMDMEPDQIGSAMKRAARLFDAKDAQTSPDHRPPQDRFIPDPGGLGVKGADLMIEALPEKLDAKTSLFKDVEPWMKADAIIATNTSSLLLGDMGQALTDPSRLVALHFFNPATKMPLVEVACGEATSDETRKRAMAFAEAIGKIPVACRDSAGFIVNRALTPYLLEAARMMEEGVEPALIDAAAERFGMAQGPVEVADTVGLDIALDVAEQLKKTFPREVGAIPSVIGRTIRKNGTGRKDGQGFYEYEDGDAKKPGVDEDDPDRLDALADRLILPLVNTCAACLREDVAESEEDIDAALIFGAGFAPFRGGPLAYVRHRGVDDVIAALERLKDQHGERFTPDEGLQALNT